MYFRRRFSTLNAAVEYFVYFLSALCACDKKICLTSPPPSSSSASGRTLNDNSFFVPSGFRIGLIVWSSSPPPLFVLWKAISFLSDYFKTNHHNNISPSPSPSNYFVRENRYINEDSRLAFFYHLKEGNDRYQIGRWFSIDWNSYIGYNDKLMDLRSKAQN